MQTEDFVLDKSSAPKSVKRGVWYSLSPIGYLADARVGHTATYVPQQRKVIFIGGASHEALHKDTWSLDLSKLTCSRLVTKGDFAYRYEHCAFIPKHRRSIENAGTKVWVFGGADMSGNMNDLCELDLDSLKWSSLTQRGEVPTNRTIHTVSSVVDSELVIFGGGAKGTAAAPDTQVYNFNAADKTWRVKPTTGKSPQARLGHVLVAVKNKLYVHGGLSGETFFDDLHVLSSDGAWSAVKVSGEKPSGRASHGAVSHGTYVYMFGGLTAGGAANDIWRIDTEGDDPAWEQILPHGDVATPAPRLDFAIALVDLPAEFNARQGSKQTGVAEGDDVNSIEEYLQQNVNPNLRKTVSNKGDSNLQNVWYPFILIHGGINEIGEVFDDLHVFGLECKKNA